MASVKSRPEIGSSIPEILFDPSTNKRYTKGRFLGKGGFAKCYELVDSETKEIFAGKIVPKSLLVKPHQKEKMTQEISIHRSLAHLHVVKFHSFFEDKDNVYILLELCRRRSLMELHKRRKAVTEPEARYFVRQVVSACQYLHNNKVIHRDLKLGNLFLNDEMDIKVGDFGLATKLDFEGERKRTLCGTPNYIAPEVLGKKGHSFEVDAWSLGCILFTLLVGKPPFETTCLKDTYMRIKKNEYHIPPRISLPARNLITKLLRADPTARPSMDSVMEDEFFTAGYLPSRLPTSCLTMAPRFGGTQRRILTEINGTEQQTEVTGNRPMTAGVKKDSRGGSGPYGQESSRPGTAPAGPNKPANSETDMQDLHDQIASVIASRPAEKAGACEDEAEDPAAMPIYWVSKWVDYSDKYGLGYQLCDNSVGVLFNDSSRLILLANGENIQYIERNGTEYFYTLKSYSEPLMKKITLLKYFRSYMSEHLLKAGANMTPRETDELTRLPFMKAWFRTRSAIVLHLSNGTLQINFFQDHTKIILCPLMGAVTYIDESKNFRVFRLKQLERYGCSQELLTRLEYAFSIVERLLKGRSLSSVKER
ncbi:serine/threonine-protein kinase PLK1-like [Liolophura sinensis]|uniref:serine/threonine-protein kinase PLK1-like n=1 Tax=Liolophura sinensis TaxID=3198878 RepID=UPI0031594824